MQQMGHLKVEVTDFYPEEFRRKIDAEKYQSKGTCEVHLLLGQIEMDLKNITYRIDHDGKISLKPPFRVHSNKKAGMKPRLVPSIVFKDSLVWSQVEKKIKTELLNRKEVHPSEPNRQLDFWEDIPIVG